MDMVNVIEENHCLNIVLNRPEKRNAFNGEMVKQLTKAFSEAEKESVRVVLLTGEGPSFSAGADLEYMKSMKQYSLKENAKDAEALQKMFTRAAQCPVPVIGLFHGHAMGGALGLLSICDFAAAVNDTKFSFSEVRLGLVPAVISPFVMKKIGWSKTSELTLTGEVFNEHRAKELGLVSFVGTESEVQDYVTQKRADIIACGPEAVRETKRLLAYVVDRSNAENKVAHETIRVIAERRVSDEGQEGLNCYFSKEKPSWVDR